jgi:DNA repair exonuclease SbcCD nuclease subunit
MRFLFFTDDHKRGTSPENRTDNFPATLVRKLKELVEIAQEYEVDYILHGGDFFDVPSPAISVCADFLEVYQQFSVPVFAIPGNHDLFGHNTATLPRTMLGTKSFIFHDYTVSIFADTHPYSSCYHLPRIAAGNVAIRSESWGTWWNLESRGEMRSRR